jgi:hypothetical protein
LFLAVAHERELGLFRNENAGLELYRLTIAGNPAGPEPDLLELLFDVGRGLLETGRPDVAPLQRVGGEILDMAPPASTFGRRILQRQRGGEGEGERTGHHCWSTDRKKAFIAAA